MDCAFMEPKKQEVVLGCTRGLSKRGRCLTRGSCLCKAKFFFLLFFLFYNDPWRQQRLQKLKKGVGKKKKKKMWGGATKKIIIIAIIPLGDARGKKVSVILYASVKRFGVSCMRDFPNSVGGGVGQ